MFEINVFGENSQRIDNLSTESCVVDMTKAVFDLLDKNGAVVISIGAGDRVLPDLQWKCQNCLSSYKDKDIARNCCK